MVAVNIAGYHSTIKNVVFRGIICDIAGMLYVVYSYVPPFFFSLILKFSIFAASIPLQKI